MESNEILQRLSDFFDREGWPTDIYEQKLYNRASLSSDAYKPDWAVIEIERHRSILGARYIEGQPMSAYQTYWMRYAVSEHENKCEELPEKYGEAFVDVPSLLEEELNGETVSLRVAGKMRGKYLIEESISNENGTISNEQEAISFALEVVENWPESFQSDLELIEPQLPEDKQNAYVSDFEDCLKMLITSLAEEAWRDREEYEDLMY